MGENRQKPLSERVHISECSTGVRAEIRELEARVEQAECLVAESDRVLGEIMLELTGDEALADNPVEYIRELSNGREQAERERDKWRIAMENLTPGGSEYYNDLERCVAVIRERFDRKSKLIRTAISRRKQAERENDNLQEQIAYLSKRCAVLTDERNAAQAELSRALDEIKILIAPHEVGGGPVAMLKQRVAELEHAIDDVRDLIDESDGVYGLHENGDLAPWDELRGGGKFECWLGSLDAAPPQRPSGQASCATSTPKVSGDGGARLLTTRRRWSTSSAAATSRRIGTHGRCAVAAPPDAQMSAAWPWISITTATARSRKATRVPVRSAEASGARGRSRRCGDERSR